jgi:hypothetical protein
MKPRSSAMSWRAFRHPSIKRLAAGPRCRRLLGGVVCAILLWQPSAQAMQCMPRTVKQQFASAELVFVGEVVSRNYQNEVSLFGHPPGEATLNVRRVLKGDAVSTVTIKLLAYSSLHGPVSPVTLDQRRPMLVFAHRSRGAWVDDLCTGTGPIKREDKRLHKLGFRQRDFVSLQLPTDNELIQRRVADWETWRSEVLACEDFRWSSQDFVDRPNIHANWRGRGDVEGKSSEQDETGLQVHRGA